jgi:hypothetical protein
MAKLLPANLLVWIIIALAILGNVLAAAFNWVNFSYFYKNTSVPSQNNYYWYNLTVAIVHTLVAIGCIGAAVLYVM